MLIKNIVKETNIPIVADIHFHYKRAIESAKSGASCLRINPGNIGSVYKVKEVIVKAQDLQDLISTNCNKRQSSRNF